MNIFPDYTRLTFDNRDKYEQIVKQYPPYSDIAFSTLMVWWNFDNALDVSMTQNNNLVIEYRLPGDEENSGTCLVGMENIDADIKTIFNYKKSEGLHLRLVHVPEFAVQNICNKKILTIVEENSYDEYIIPTSRLYPLESVHTDERRKIKRFTEVVGKDNIKICSLDLDEIENQKLLLRNAYKWWKETPRTNDVEGNEQKAMQKSLALASNLGMNNLCLYVSDELVGFVTYHISHDGRYYIGAHLKAKRIPYIFDYLEYLVAQKAYENDVQLLNIEMDLGLPGLRTHKLGLRPIDFFRKYSITLA